MIGNVFNLVDLFQGKRVLVIGEAILDTYIKGNSTRLCQEAPVPIVDARVREDAPGGAANAAVNINALRGKVHFLSVIGDDAEGERLCDQLENQGISTPWLVIEPGRRTLVKTRILSDGQLLLRFDQGDTTPISPASRQSLLRHLRHLMREVDAVLISDYRYGILVPEVIAEMEELQSARPGLIVADSKDLSAFRRLNLAAVKPNYHQAAALLGLPRLETAPERIEQIVAHGDAILEATGACMAAVTLDQDGALIFERGEPHYRIFARPAPNNRAAGAGDTFISALTLSLAAGAETSSAAEVASMAASIVVEKNGTSACDADELKAYFTGGEKVISDVFHMAARVASYKRQGLRVVFTNGCFDIIHSGHISYLNQAKEQGDILVIGVNTDESVQRLKGPGRPINSLEDRVQVLAALSSVDHIIPFSEAMPTGLIQAIEPDVYVKGGDYTVETLPEAQLVQSLGGVVKLLPYIENHSTTGMIAKICKLYTEG